MNREALEQLKRVLSNVDDQYLNMESWVCGTTACAAGWATQDDWFRERGLMLEKGLMGTYPVYKEKKGWAALQLFFDIHSATCIYLFDEDDYGAEEVTTTDVIRHIDNILIKEPSDEDNS